MKKVAKAVVALAIVAVVVLSACSTVQPDAGHEAVLVRKPLIFGSGGVDRHAGEDRPEVRGLHDRRHRRQHAAACASTRSSPT